MARGRTAVPKAPTKFLNSKRRVIYMTAEGKYLAKSAKGATQKRVTCALHSCPTPL